MLLLQHDSTQMFSSLLPYFTLYKSQLPKVCVVTQQRRERVGGVDDFHDIVEKKEEEILPSLWAFIWCKSLRVKELFSVSKSKHINKSSHGDGGLECSPWNWNNLEILSLNSPVTATASPSMSMMLRSSTSVTGLVLRRRKTFRQFQNKVCAPAQRTSRIL